MEQEIWKPVKDFGGKYDISNHGRIRSNINSGKGLYKKSFRNRDGYLYVRLQLPVPGGKAKTLKVHRLVAQHFVENPDNKPHIDHINANKLCNYSWNLRWCTHAENISFGWETGRYNNVGEKHGMSKLTTEKVIEIKTMCSTGVNDKDIAAAFNLSRRHVTDIRNGKAWKHVILE